MGTNGRHPTKPVSHGRIPRMGQKIDLAGKRFGAWTVVRFVRLSKCRVAQWLCRCDCGTERVVDGASLRRGNTSSCGCRQRELQTRHAMKHGERYTHLYKLWANMKRKERNRRKIPVCSEWEEYWPFAEWARSHGYRQGLVLSRIDISRGWFPENVCFKLTKNTSHGTIPYKPIPKADKNGRRIAP